MTKFYITVSGGRTNDVVADKRDGGILGCAAQNVRHVEECIQAAKRRQRGG